jgi:hypothetical protein
MGTLDNEIIPHEVEELQETVIDVPTYTNTPSHLGSNRPNIETVEVVNIQTPKLKSSNSKFWYVFLSLVFID